MTVEALAAYFGRPLYALSFGELGSTAAELEERLTDVLNLSNAWGAFVLLDEGDALVERRQRGHITLNSMTNVLLRLLESFNGALFLTSNRAKCFDPAALSRVTLAIRYDALDDDGKAKVWINLLSRIFMVEHNHPRTQKEAQEMVEKEFDLDVFRRFEGSGRSIGAILRLAIGLAEQRDKPLTQIILNDAISTWSEFHAQLDEDAGPQTWEN